MVISELIIRENYLCSQADRVFRGDYLATKKQKEKWDTICRTLYHEYNRIYFGGSLPKNIKFKFRKMRNWGGFCAAHENTITLNSYYFTDYFDEDERGHFTTDYARMISEVGETLRHEMQHYKDYIDNGNKYHPKPHCHGFYDRVARLESFKL